MGISTTTEGIFSYIYTHSHNTHTQPVSGSRQPSHGTTTPSTRVRLQHVGGGGGGRSEGEEDDTLGAKEEAEGRYHVLLERITRLKEALLSELTE